MTLNVSCGEARPVRPGLLVDRRAGLCPKARASVFLSGLVFFLIGGIIAPRADAIAEPMARSQGTVVEPIPAPRHPREMTYMKRKWGVELTFVRATAAGYMIELRYKVLDPGKAAPLFVRKTKPVLTHIETGLQLAVASPAKSGPLRSSDEPLPDHTYWMLFANPHRIVKAGDRVNLQIGDFAVEGLIVR